MMKPVEPENVKYKAGNGGNIVFGLLFGFAVSVIILAIYSCQK